MFKNYRLNLLFLAAALGVAACSQKLSPKVSLSPERIAHKGWVQVHGEGFTPLADIRSHLKKPDGVEFPVLPMYTDEEGKFKHEIDTLLLTPGIHELWVIDSTTGVSSNVAKFELTLGPPDAPR